MSSKAVTSEEFYTKFKDVLGLPNELVEFNIKGRVDKMLEIECVIWGIIDSDQPKIKTRYKLVAIDDE